MYRLVKHAASGRGLKHDLRKVSNVFHGLRCRDLAVGFAPSLNEFPCKTSETSWTC